MNNAILLAVLVGGILLLFFGIIAYDSTSSDLSRFFSGSATAKSIWMLVCGAMAIVVGVMGLSRKSSQK